VRPEVPGHLCSLRGRTLSAAPAAQQLREWQKEWKEGAKAVKLQARAAAAMAAEGEDARDSGRAAEREREDAAAKAERKMAALAAEGEAALAAFAMGDDGDYDAPEVVAYAPEVRPPAPRAGLCGTEWIVLGVGTL
jgi:hypothetical protein